MPDSSDMSDDELDLWSDINNPNNDADMDDWADGHNPNNDDYLEDQQGYIDKWLESLSLQKRYDIQCFLSFQRSKCSIISGAIVKRQQVLAEVVSLTITIYRF